MSHLTNSQMNPFMNPLSTNLLCWIQRQTQDLTSIPSHWVQPQTRSISLSIPLHWTHLQTRNIQLPVPLRWSCHQTRAYRISDSVTMVALSNTDPHDTNSVTLAARPNTEHLSDHYDPQESISYEAQITLSIHGIKSLLRDYPDQTFVDILVGIVKHGAKIGYTKPPSKIRLRNHHSSFANAHIIDQAIRKELQAGRMKAISHLPSNKIRVLHSDSHPKRQTASKLVGVSYSTFLPHQGNQLTTVFQRDMAQYPTNHLHMLSNLSKNMEKDAK